jgi:hydrogenase-4 component F
MYLVFGIVRTNYPAGLDPDSRNFSGIFRAMPWAGALLSLGGLALVGSPPFNLFVSEFIILWAAIQRSVEHSNMLLLGAVVFYLGSIVLIFAGLIRHLGPMLMGKPPVGALPERVDQIAPLVLFFGLILLLGFVIPVIGIFDLPQLLQQSTAVLTFEVQP